MVPYRYKLRLETQSDCAKFVTAVASLPSTTFVHITDGNGLCVNGRSLLGVLYTLEFSQLWLESNKEVYLTVKDFVDSE